MSDYFAALSRSAGPVREAREPMRDDPVIVEQDVERASDSPGIAQASSPLIHAEPATIAAEISDSDRKPVAIPDLPEALVPNAAVHAALRWIAADPARQPGPSTRSIVDETPRRAASPASKQQIDAPPPTANDSDSPNAEPALIEIQTAAPAARDRPARPERARTLIPDATVVDHRVEEMPPLHEERVEVSIGTIHVRVDAPSPPAVVAQPRQTAQPRPERREERSSFSRSRIPRI